MGAAATGVPLFPAGLVAGTITITGGQIGVPQQLLALIQAQLDANCPGAGQEVVIQNDIAGVNLYIGRSSTIKGDMSTSNYGMLLTAGQTYTFRTSFPGSHSPVGDLQVFASASATFHVVIQ